MVEEERQRLVREKMFEEAHAKTLASMQHIQLSQVLPPSFAPSPFLPLCVCEREMCLSCGRSRGGGGRWS